MRLPRQCCECSGILRGRRDRLQDFTSVCVRLWEWTVQVDRLLASISQRLGLELPSNSSSNSSSPRVEFRCDRGGALDGLVA